MDEIPINQIDLTWEQLFELIPLQKNALNDLVITPETIPVILVPGIMGSRLMNQEGTVVWDPSDEWAMGINFGVFWVNASDKRQVLIGSGQHSPNGVDPI